MAEKAVFYARAVVYYFDPKTKGWTPTAVGSNFCRVDMYENTGNNTFRVIGRGLQDTTKVVINSNVTKDTQYTRASETFHQWSDNRYIYGLNFVTKEEAESFGTGFEQTVSKLKGGSGSGSVSGGPPPPPQPPQPPTQSLTSSSGSFNSGMSSSSSSGGGGPPPPPQPPTAPQPPPAPKVSSNSSSDSGGGGRSGLLSSISGFSKGGLKKVATVDKSAPVLTKEQPKSGGGGGGGGGGGMMGDILAQRQRMQSAKETGNPSGGTLKKTAPSDSGPSPSLTPSSKSTMHIPVKLPTSSPANNNRSGSVSSGSSSSSSYPTQSSSASNSNNAHSNISNSELQALKEEILSEVRKELQRVKEEILSAINNR